MVKQFTDSNFKEELTSNEQLVVVDFWAEWCGPCKMIGPIIEDLSKDLDGQATFAKLNVDHNPNISQEFNIRSIPSILMFKGGQLVNKVVGAVPRKKLEDEVKKYI